MPEALISFRLLTMGGPCDRREYRLQSLPRVGEHFRDGSDTFQVTAVMHNAHRQPEVFAKTVKFTLD